MWEVHLASMNSIKDNSVELGAVKWMENNIPSKNVNIR